MREALELAVDPLNEDLAIEGPEREFLSTMTARAGSPDLANVILQTIRMGDVCVGSDSSEDDPHRRARSS